MSGSRTRFANHFGTPWSVMVCGNQSPHIILSTSFQYDTLLAYIRQISSSVMPSCSSMICSYAPCGIRVTSVILGALIFDWECRAVPHSNSNETVAHSNIITFTGYFVLGHTMICKIIKIEKPAMLVYHHTMRADSLTVQASIKPLSFSLLE